MYSFLAPFSRRRNGGPALVDPAGQPLHSYFKIADWNSGSNSIVSSASAGDSGSRTASSNGSNGSTLSSINGQPAINGTAYWLRLNSVVENTGIAASPPIPDFMWTLVLRLTQDPVGTSSGGPSVYTTRLMTDSSQYWGAYLYKSGGVIRVGAQGSVTSASASNSWSINVEQPTPAIGTTFIYQWGVISREVVARINLGPWVAGGSVPSGGNPFPADGIYSIPGQNFHIGYSPAGATYYYNGMLGDMISTLGVKPASVYDEITYWLMQKYGVP